MPLDTNRLKGTIKAAYQNCRNHQGSEDEALESFCQDLAQAIVTEIKQAKIAYTTGLAAGAAPVTGTFNHTIT